MKKKTSGREKNCCMAYGIKSLHDSGSGGAGGICSRWAE